MTNIPAFPQIDPVQNVLHENYGNDRGMTLRDYFAAKAMQAIIGNLADWEDMPSRVARYAYEQADIMLKYRDIK